jgi:hypothetical protein
MDTGREKCRHKQYSNLGHNPPYYSAHTGDSK